MTSQVVGSNARWDTPARVFVASAFASSTAAIALTTAVGKQMYDLTGREIDLGLLGLTEFAPAALLILVTGTIADRRSRKQISTISMIGQAAICAVAWTYTAGDGTGAGPIFAIVFSFGVAKAFASPASRALIADIVAPERLPWLIPRRSAAVQASFVVGPVLGGSLYAVDPAAPYAAATLLLVAAAALMAIVKVRRTSEVPSSPAASRASDTLDGLRFIRRDEVLLGAVLLDLFAVMFGGALVLLPAIAEDRLQVGAVGYGWLRAATGIGAAAVTILVARRPVRRRVGRVLLASIVVYGAATTVLGATTTYAIAFAAVVVLSGAGALATVVRQTLVPLLTPPDKRGRVSAVELMFIGAADELGAFESGVTGQVLGSGPAVAVGGAATIAVAGVWWRCFPRLRDLDEFPRPPVPGRETPVQVR